jgi:hypothetical protein
MRALAFCLIAAGCQGSAVLPPVPAPPSLAMRLQFIAPPTPVGDLQIATAGLHLARVTAVCDRAAADPRASLSAVDLSMGASFDAPSSPAPPGLYSSVNAVLDDDAGVGVNIAGAWGGMALHVQVASSPFAIGCPSPVRLEPGQRVQLRLQVDPTHWFDGVDLSTALSDSDDDGIVLSAYDNRGLAAAVLANVIASFQLECAPAG